jgi:glutaredoxin
MTLMLLPALVLLIAASAPVLDAQKHLSQHKLDEVLFDLQGKKLDGADAREAAQILGKAAIESFADSLISLQFAQMALKYDPNQLEALEAGARAAFAQKQFDLAEPYADRWIAASHRSSHARLLRAQIAVDEGDWQLAEKIAPDPNTVFAEDRPAAAAIRKLAHQELNERNQGLSQTRELEQAMKAAQIREGNRPRGPKRDGANAEAGARAPNVHSVTLYGTAWCTYCSQARTWFTSHHIDFEDKDVEKDAAAAQELARRADEEHVEVHGVPVIDVHGKLVSGFSVGQIQEALHQ